MPGRPLSGDRELRQLLQPSSDDSKVAVFIRQDSEQVAFSIRYVAKISLIEHAKFFGIGQARKPSSLSFFSTVMLRRELIFQLSTTSHRSMNDNSGMIRHVADLDEERANCFLK